MLVGNFGKNQKVSKYYDSNCLQNFTLFCFLCFYYVFINSCILISLILDEDSEKGLRVTEIDKESNFEGYGTSYNKKRFPRATIQKIFEINSSFNVK